MRSRLTFALVVALVTSLSACGQTLALPQLPPASPTSPTREKVAEWLASGDPRMIAWGAHFSVELNDTDGLPLLERIANSWQTRVDTYTSAGGYAKLSEAEQDLAAETSAVLDAVIQLHGTVEPDAIRRLAPNFFGQAVVLLVAMPEAQRQPLAASIYAERKPLPLVGARQPTDYPQSDLYQVAAMILAKVPPPGFTASLLNETSTRLTIEVLDPHDSRGPALMGGTGTCGDSLYTGPRPGWPEGSTYVVEQQWPGSALYGVTALLRGNMTLTYRRALTTSSCSYLSGLNDTVRINLIAQIAEVATNNLGWSLSASDRIRYRSAAAYRADLRRVVQKHLAAFQDTNQWLLDRHLLTPAEAADARPDLTVSISDLRTKKTPPLPTVSMRWRKTTLARD